MLRDHLLTSLGNLPDSRRLHLHVLTSVPRKHTGLFPYAKYNQKVVAQDILILLSEQKLPEESPRVLVSGIEAVVYTIPTTSCTILYVSKVDSTGQGLVPTPTSTLVRSFLSYFLNPLTRRTDHLWIHIFARAQGQYLFPNSSEYSHKNVLSDSKLCAWWKRVLTAVAQDSHPHQSDPNHTVKAFYVLPGLSELEAIQTLREPFDAQTSPLWHYGHPYAKHGLILPLGNINSELVADLIPSFPDDPKSRFLDELRVTRESDTLPVSPPRKRLKTAHTDANADANASSKPRSINKAMAITPDEFWERMSFRQECVSGAITGFFVLASTSESRDKPELLLTLPQAETGQVSEQTHARIVASLTTGHDFSTVERSVRATDVLEDAIRGLCQGLKPPSSSEPTMTLDPRGAEREKHEILERNDSGNGIRDPCSDETSDPRAPESTLLTQESVSAQHRPDPLSLDIYYAFIYGTVAVENPPLPPKTSQSPHDSDIGSQSVNILTVKRKKKRP